ncbi:hypothetical protein TKK_0012826 [Trichogramma kaykai]
MEHAKKLVLLPKESVERLGCGGGSDIVIVEHKKSVQTPGTPLERLDAEMNEILLAPCSDECAKSNRYNNVLQRYLQLLQTSQHISEKKNQKRRSRPTLTMLAIRAKTSLPR